MKHPLLLTCLFPGIVQVYQGQIKLGVLLLSINWFFFYALWPIIMPIALGITIKQLKIREEKETTWAEELTEILRPGVR